MRICYSLFPFFLLVECVALPVFLEWGDIKCHIYRIPQVRGEIR
jgi:hypothetical protein